MNWRIKVTKIFKKRKKKIVGRIPLKWAKWKGPSNYLSEFFILIFSFSSWFLDYFLSFILVKFCFDGCSVELFSVGLFKCMTDYASHCKYSGKDYEIDTSKQYLKVYQEFMNRWTCTWDLYGNFSIAMDVNTTISFQEVEQIISKR